MIRNFFLPWFFRRRGPAPTDPILAGHAILGSISAFIVCIVIFAIGAHAVLSYHPPFPYVVQWRQQPKGVLGVEVTAESWKRLTPTQIGAWEHGIFTLRPQTSEIAVRDETKNALADVRRPPGIQVNRKHAKTQKPIVLKH